MQGKNCDLWGGWVLMFETSWELERSLLVLQQSHEKDLTSGFCETLLVIKGVTHQITAFFLQD
jgi:hypothetical protein